MTRTIEAGRLRRAKTLLRFTEELAPGVFRVRGVDEPTYIVQLDGDPPCYCKDSFHNGHKFLCKHELAGRWWNLEDNVLIAAQAMLEAQEQQEKKEQTA